MNSGNWYYLLEKRPNANNLVTFVYLDGVPGLVVFPDEWENTTGISVGFNPDGIATYNKDIVEGNHFSKNQWKKLEKTGAVFLPAVGWRIGQDMSYSTDGSHSPRYYSERSYYWCGNITFEGSEPWILEVMNGGAQYREVTYFDKGRPGYANRGFFVRLVKDVK